jgi:O-antigen/teichoic acid export membrane protein
MKFRSPYFIKAFHFGYPLMVNGIGLAAMSQGDRFVVGSLLGLPTLGIYAVMTLVTTVPLGMIMRVTGTVTSRRFTTHRKRRTAPISRASSLRPG